MGKFNYAAWKREWRRKNPEKVLAYRAKRAIYMRAYYKKYYPENREAISKRQKENRRKRAKYIADFFGGCCVRCGFEDVRALQMDHTHGRNGEKRIGNIDSRYKFVRKNPKEARKKYQLLCANCNFIKMFENGEHRKPKPSSGERGTNRCIA